MAWYCDSSALVKLIVEEDETRALLDVVRHRMLVTSELALTEAGRAILRKAGPSRRPEAKVVQRIHMLPITTGALRRAATLQPPALRTLDAIHIASALQLDDDCDGIITYDRRMQEASRLAGLPVEAPGQLGSSADN